jgi:hypothetical protein
VFVQLDGEKLAVEPSPKPSKPVLSEKEATEKAAKKKEEERSTWWERARALLSQDDDDGAGVPIKRKFIDYTSLVFAAAVRPLRCAGGGLDYSKWDAWVANPDDPVTLVGLVVSVASRVLPWTLSCAARRRKRGRKRSETIEMTPSSRN